MYRYGTTVALEIVAAGDEDIIRRQVQCVAVGNGHGHGWRHERTRGPSVDIQVSPAAF